MRDGYTRQKQAPANPGASARFLGLFRATLVVTSGPEAGTEYTLEAESTSLGRGPGADLVFADDLMSREHCAIDVTNDGLRIRDLGSLNGLSVNGADLRVAELKHGDRFRAGNHEFQILLEEREAQTPTYELPEE